MKMRPPCTPSLYYFGLSIACSSDSYVVFETKVQNMLHKSELNAKVQAWEPHEVSTPAIPLKKHLLTESLAYWPQFNIECRAKPFSSFSNLTCISLFRILVTRYSDNNSSTCMSSSRVLYSSIALKLMLRNQSPLTKRKASF